MKVISLEDSSMAKVNGKEHQLRKEDHQMNIVESTEMTKNGDMESSNGQVATYTEANLLTTNAAAMER